MGQIRHGATRISSLPSEVTPGPAVPEEAGSRLLHTSCLGEVGSSLTGSLWLFPIHHVNTIEQPPCAQYHRRKAFWVTAEEPVGVYVQILVPLITRGAFLICA